MYVFLLSLKNIRFINQLISDFEVYTGLGDFARTELKINTFQVIFHFSSNAGSRVPNT